MAQKGKLLTASTAHHAWNLVPAWYPVQLPAHGNPGGEAVMAQGLGETRMESLLLARPSLSCCGHLRSEP